MTKIILLITVSIIFTQNLMAEEITIAPQRVDCSAWLNDSEQSALAEKNISVRIIVLSKSRRLNSDGNYFSGYNVELDKQPVKNLTTDLQFAGEVAFYRHEKSGLTSSSFATEFNLIIKNKISKALLTVGVNLMFNNSTESYPYGTLTLSAGGAGLNLTYRLDCKVPVY